MTKAGRALGRSPAAVLAGATALAAIAVTAMSVPLAADERKRSTSKDCIETLTEQYGATEFSNVNDRFRNSRRSVYLDAKLGSGKTVRMRCLFESGGVSQIQTYEEPGVGSSVTWPTWGPADKYRLPEDAAADTDTASTDAEAAATPDEPEPGSQPSEQPADETDADSAEQPAEEPEGESAEEAGEQAEQQFGVRKQAP